MIVTVVARIPPSGVRAFAEYEDAVLPLLGDHEAGIERRLRNADGTMEIQVLDFPHRAAYDAFLRDPRRVARRFLLEASGAQIEIHVDLDDVPA